MKRMSYIEDARCLKVNIRCQLICVSPQKQILIESEHLCRLVCDAVHSGSNVTSLAGERASDIITADKKSTLSKHVFGTGALGIAASFVH